MYSRPLLGDSRPKVRRTQPALHTELVLVEVGIHEGHVGDAVMYQRDLGFGYVVRCFLDISKALGLITTSRSEISAKVCQNSSVGSGFGSIEHSVQGRNDRHANLPEERNAGNARPGLHRCRIRAAHTRTSGLAQPDEIGGQIVLLSAFLLDLKANKSRIGVSFGSVVHRHGKTLGLGGQFVHGLAEIAGECGNAAAARKIVSEKRDFFKG